MEEIFKAAGHSGVFDVNVRQAEAEAEAWARDLVSRYASRFLASLSSHDPIARKDAMRIASLKDARESKNSCVFYPTVEEIFEAAGHRGVFEPTQPRVIRAREDAESWAKACARRYAPGCLPSTASANPDARTDAKKIASMRDAKRGKGSCVFRPAVEQIFEAAGHSGVFDVASRQAEAESWARGCEERYRPGQLPSTRSKDPSARKEGIKIDRMRIAKRGEGNYAFYPSVELIFEESGHQDIFGPDAATSRGPSRRRLTGVA